VCDLISSGGRGCASLAAQATVPLEKARRLEPEKASIREALGIAYFRITDWSRPSASSGRCSSLSPVDEYWRQRRPRRELRIIGREEIGWRSTSSENLPCAGISRRSS
jgi:hypothetical protein